jgi:hypothetical protein
VRPTQPARANGGPSGSIGPASPVDPLDPTSPVHPAAEPQHQARQQDIRDAPVDPREARRAARARAWRYGRYSWLRRQWPLLLVLTLVAAGLATVVIDGFRPGTVILASAVLLAAVFRLFFPSRIVGLLVLRSRAMDVVTLTILGVSALVLALIVPDIR